MYNLKSLLICLKQWKSIALYVWKYIQVELNPWKWYQPYIWRFTSMCYTSDMNIKSWLDLIITEVLSWKECVYHNSVLWCNIPILTADIGETKYARMRIPWCYDNRFSQSICLSNDRFGETLKDIISDQIIIWIFLWEQYVLKMWLQPSEQIGWIDLEMIFSSIFRHPGSIIRNGETEWCVE